MKQGGEEKGSLLSSPHPPRFIFCALPIFRGAKSRSLADPGFSFRLKRTGTLAKIMFARQHT